jgi:hypothetical protein
MGPTKTIEISGTKKNRCEFWQSSPLKQRIKYGQMFIHIAS